MIIRKRMDVIYADGKYFMTSKEFNKSSRGRKQIFNAYKVLEMKETE